MKNNYTHYLLLLSVLCASTVDDLTAIGRKRKTKSLVGENQSVTPQATQEPTDFSFKKNNAEDLAKHKEEAEIVAQKQPTQLVPHDITTLENTDIKTDERIWDHNNQDDTVELDLKEAGLTNLVDYIQEQFNVTFLTDDAINPVSKDGQAIAGSKVTFQTHKPLTKKQAWNVFITFLDMANLALVPTSDSRFYRIMATDPSKKMSANRAPLQAYIGTDPERIPDNDMKIRYVYFVQNSSVATIKGIIESMTSTSASKVNALDDLRAIVFTDKASNIKALMKVVTELDRVTMPEVMSVLKLRRADASDVVKLYKELMQPEQGSTVVARLGLAPRKQSSTAYFPEGTRVIAEPRTNSLILLGSQEGIKKIEEFIVKHVDTELDMPYSPLHVYQLKHVNADSIAAILKDVTQFQPETEAAKSGGIRDGEKYFKPMSFIPEKSGNRLIIRAEEEDYQKVKDIIDNLDVEQPQVAIKVLILSVTLNDAKALGIQLRNKVGNLGGNVNFQTSGLAGTGGNGIIQKDTSGQGSGATKLLGDLIQLATGSRAGQTIVTLGQDACGVWGMFRALQTVARTTVIANPFLVTTNKYQANISLGTIRRIPAATIFGVGGETQSFEDNEANLEVNVTPQISSDGLIKLDVAIKSAQFTGDSGGDKTVQTINSSAILANKEVLALAGIKQSSTIESTSNVPLLGRIPVLGWLFKNKQKNVNEQDLLVLLSPEILLPEFKANANEFTRLKLKNAHESISSMSHPSESRDPIHRWFFKDQYEDGALEKVDDFVTREARYSQEVGDREAEGYCYPPADTHHSNKPISELPTRPKPSTFATKALGREQRSITNFIEEGDAQA